LCNKIKPMGVALRKKVNKDNTTTLYLDIYHNGKRSYEFMQHLRLATKPASPIERQTNKDNLDLAKKIKAKREHELESSEYDITPAFKQKIDFIAFYQSFIDGYTKKDKRVVEASLGKFIAFLNASDIKNLTTNQVDENLANDFKTYLIDNLNGESPANYFKKFKMVIKNGVRKKIFLVNPAQDLSISIKGSIKKQVLSNDEIQLLASTPITNNEVKRAFLFSLFTGLRYCDIKNIKWQNIDFKNGLLNIVQQKTSELVTLELHQTALQILGKPAKPNDLIFNLPSHTACSKNLKNWCIKAEINKKITWHCARHSFATNLIFYGADVNTASKLLGHNSLRYTERYTHIVKSLKVKAINNLPAVEM
jgi:integrase/recombinase XerD